MQTKTVSLVLGSGGAKGLAHIGVIRCLVDRGYEVHYVAGSSIGALVGGIFAAGKLDAYVDWVMALQRIDVLRLLDLSFDGGGLFKGERIMASLRDLIGDRDIQGLPVGFTAVATDLFGVGAGREVWFNQGQLFDAIRASIAVPTIFEPVRTDGQLLVDGGVINPLPVAPTLNDRTDITIAVDLNGPSNPQASLPAPDPSLAISAIQKTYQQNIGQYLDRFLPTARVRSKPDRPGFSDIAMRSMESMQTTITQFKLAANAPNILISIPRNLCGFFDFDRAEDLIAFGHQRATRALDQHESRQNL